MITFTVLRKEGKRSARLSQGAAGRHISNLLKILARKNLLENSGRLKGPHGQDALSPMEVKLLWCPRGQGHLTEMQGGF